MPVAALRHRASKAFERHVRQAAPPRIPLQGLRHTYATLALSSGVNPRIVSGRLAHSTVALTLDIYRHVLPQADGDAAERIAALIEAEADLPDCRPAPSSRFSGLTVHDAPIARPPGAITALTLATVRHEARAGDADGVAAQALIDIGHAHHGGSLSRIHPDPCTRAPARTLLRMPAWP